eukprot:9482182-Pyramimonas_sp.AAC.2
MMKVTAIIQSCQAMKGHVSTDEQSGDILYKRIRKEEVGIQDASLAVCAWEGRRRGGCEYGRQGQPVRDKLSEEEDAADLE